MLKAAGRAFAQLLDPAIFGVLLISVAGAVLVLAGIGFGTASLLEHVHLFQTGWLDWLARAAIGVGAAFATAAMFGAVAAVIASLLVERVARAVERRYYPDLPAPRRQSVWESLRLGLSFLLAMVVLNLLALPLYLVWGPNLPVFLALNGYLLGREYFELVAVRRMDRASIAILRRTYPFRLLIGGMLIAALSFLPLANLVTPVVATAFMLHIFQGLPESQKGLPRQAVR